MREHGTAARLAAAAALAVIFTLALGPITDPDLWWHLETGELVAGSGWVPLRDTFSATAAGRPWRAYSWLAELLFYHLAAHWGFGALVVLRALLVTATFWVVRRTCLLGCGRPGLATALALLAATVSAPTWCIRPQLFSFLLTAVTAHTLTRHRLGLGAPLGLLPPLLALWANLHILFVVGLGLLWLHVAAELWPRAAAGRGGACGRRLLPVAVLATACCLLNPYGFGLAAEALRLAGEPVRAAAVVEFRSPDFHTATGWGLALLAGLALVPMLATRPLREDAFDRVFLLLCLPAALFMLRSLPYFAILAAPVAARAWGRLVAARQAPAAPASPAQSRAAVALAAGALLGTLLAAARHLPTQARWEANVSPGAFPVGAAAYLAAAPRAGRLLNPFNWGGFLIYRLAGRYRVAIDGRTRVYGPLLAEYTRLHRLEPGWEAFLERVRPDVVLWHADHPLVRLLEARGWRAVYEDPVAVVLRRPARSATGPAGRAGKGSLAAARQAVRRRCQLAREPRRRLDRHATPRQADRRRERPSEKEYRGAPAGTRHVRVRPRAR